MAAPVVFPSATRRSRPFVERTVMNASLAQPVTGLFLSSHKIDASTDPVAA
jgi:hypothetical protein